MVDSPLVSVVIPVFNGEKYLSEAVESILSQTLSNIELIIVDDGSTDNTKRILAKFSKIDERVNVLKQPNMGVSTSRNNAIKKARANFIALMDADDISEPTRLEKQYEYMMSHSDVTALASQINFICPRGVKLASSAFNTMHEDIENALLQDDGQHFCQPSVMFRKDKAFEVGLYDVTLSMGEDVDFFLKLATAGKLHTLDQCLLNYRRHISNATASDNLMKHNFELDYLKKAWATRGLSFPKNFVHWSVSYKPRSKESYFHQWGWNALKKGELSIARKYAIDLMIMNPLNISNVKFLLCSLRGY